MKYGSLFAGVGGFDLGFDAAGWDCGFQVEWDRQCQQVLARHWPDVPRWSDVRDVNGADLPPVDCITYGFPCQDLSVAGARAGLDGARSGLFFDAVRIIKEMRDATGGKYPTWAVAENVVGLLNADGGDAMGRCLDTLADIGAVAVEWAVLDAEHFGVPQRRRRVFLVACFDPDLGLPDEILPVATSCCGHSQTSEPAGETTARTLAQCLNSGGNNGGFRTEPGSHLVAVAKGIDRTSAAVTAKWAKGSGGPAGDEVQNLVAVKRGRSRSADDAETWSLDGPAPTLNVFDNNGEIRATVLAFDSTFSWQSRVFEDCSPTLKVGTGLGISSPPAALVPSCGVRRLTPVECERLMGWPDDHTRYDADGNELADTVRYRMCGNGIAAPVAQWVAENLLSIGSDR